MGKFILFKSLSDAQVQALKDAGHEIKADAVSAADHLALTLKNSTVGTAIVSAVHDVTDKNLTGLQKLERVVADALPVAVEFFAGGGVTVLEKDVEDAVRAAAQLIFNDVGSQTVPKLIADAEKFLGITPPA